MAMRILIVEDHSIMQEVLSELVEDIEDLELGGIARTGEEALERIETLDVDLALVDMSLPAMSGEELIRQMRERRPDLPCLVLSGHSHGSYVRRALAAGARGYVLKGDPYELERAIHDVLEGNIYLSKPLRQTGNDDEQEGLG